MHSALGGAGWGGMFVKLVVVGTEHGVRWVVRGSSARESARSLDCAGSFANANDPAALGMTDGSAALGMTDGSATLGMTSNDPDQWSMMAVADVKGEWWARLRGNPKRSGEISQAAFLLQAEMRGFLVALPWGDSERYDFLVCPRKGGRSFRVQVKGTGRLYRQGYEVQPVHTTRRGGKKRYSKKEIDVIAAHLQPLDAWYLIPIEKVGRAKSLRFRPGMKSGRRKWEKWREAWSVLGQG